MNICLRFKFQVPQMINMLLHFKLLRDPTIIGHLILLHSLSSFHLHRFLVVNFRLNFRLVIRQPLKQVLLVDKPEVRYNLLSLFQCLVILRALIIIVKRLLFGRLQPVLEAILKGLGHTRILV